MVMLLQAPLLPFTAALGMLLVLALLQLVGIGLDADADLDGGNAGGLGHALDWLNAGQLPILVLAIVALASFAIAGVLIQSAAQTAVGLLPWPVASVAALATAVPATRWLSRPLARVLPLDETTAVAIDSLLGRRARIVLGTARSGSPARAQVEDRHGRRHFVMVEPAGDGVLTADDLLLLVTRDGPHFLAITIPPDAFTEIGL